MTSKSNARTTETGTGSPTNLSFTDAAEQVLRQHRGPLKYTEITKRAVDQKFLITESQNPSISMYVSLRSELKRRSARSEPQRFAFQGRGVFGLLEFTTHSAQKTKTAVEQVRESREEAMQQVYDKLTSANNGDHFETMVGDLLLDLGYQNVEVIGGKDDQGVDITCERREGITTVRFAVQCKCKSLKNKIGPKDVSNLRDNLSTYGCQQGILITTSELNEEAKKKAVEPGKDRIHFIEHGQLLELFAEHKIGLQSESIAYFQLDASEYDFLK